MNSIFKTRLNFVIKIFSKIFFKFELFCLSKLLLMLDQLKGELPYKNFLIFSLNVLSTELPQYASFDVLFLYLWFRLRDID